MMKTRWENWEATLGQVTAEYEAKRVWAEEQGRRLKFTLYIQIEANDRFYVKVKDWRGLDGTLVEVYPPLYFNTIGGYVPSMNGGSFKRWFR